MKNKRIWVRNKGWKWWHWFCRLPIRSFTQKIDDMCINMLFLGPYIRFSGTPGIIDMIVEQHNAEKD